MNIFKSNVCVFPWASLVAQLVKNPLARLETWVRSLGWEYPLEKGKATYSSILAWRIPWTTVYAVAKSRTRKSDQNTRDICLSLSDFA